MSSKLFQPIIVSQFELAHRVVLAPLTRFRSPNHVPNDVVAEYYGQRATEGGLLITEATFISDTAGGYPGTPGIYNEEQVQAWKKVTDRVHAKGGRIFLQLWHVGRATAAALIGGKQPMSASEIAIKGNNLLGQPHEVPHALTIPEIKEIVEDYKKAAKNAIAAGFDGVEQHSANGYLLDQFINTFSNKRTDEYGGSIPNRARFSLEVLDTLVETVGANRVGVRYSPWSEFQDMNDDTPVETWSYITTQIQNNHPDLAYIHFTEPRVKFWTNAERVVENHENLDHFRKIWQGPFISAGGYDREAAIARSDKTGDLIAFGRHFIANPDLPYRLENNLPFNPYNRATFKTNEPEGYTDYPFYENTAKSA